MSDPIDAAVESFKRNVNDVLQLSDLDRGVLEFAIQAIEKRDNRLRKAGFDNDRFMAENAAQHIRNIRQNDSLRSGFQALVNQSVVLLVSYFASGVSAVFRSAISLALRENPSASLLRHEIRLTVAEACALDAPLIELVPDLIADDPSISFQDTKSIQRTFRNYFDVEIARDQDVNDIILGMACRHALVHNGGLVNRRCLHQIRDANPRSLKSSLSNGQVLQFETEEVGILCESMVRYVERLRELLKSRVSGQT